MNAVSVNRIDLVRVFEDGESIGGIRTGKTVGILRSSAVETGVMALLLVGKDY